jgi:hypothetical protein
MSLVRALEHLLKDLPAAKRAAAMRELENADRELASVKMVLRGGRRAKLDDLTIDGNLYVDGKLTAGRGENVIDQDGITLLHGSADRNKLKWVRDDFTTVFGEIYTTYSGSPAHIETLTARLTGSPTTHYLTFDDSVNVPQMPGLLLGSGAAPAAGGGDLKLSGGLNIGSTSSGAPSGSIEMQERAAVSTPSSGLVAVYADEDQSWLYAKNDAGEAVPLGVARVNLPVDAAQLSSATSVLVQTHHTAISYADAATQSAYWSFRLPPGWAGRTMVVKILWAPSTTNNGDCLWSTDYFKQVAGTTLSSTATETDNVVSTASGTADRPQAATIASYSLAALATGDAIVLRISRAGANGLDTFTGAARVLAVELSVVG